MKAARLNRVTREAVRQGHDYVAHGRLCQARRFAFVAEQKRRLVAVMGGEIKSSGAITFRADTPVVCTLAAFDICNHNQLAF